VLVNDGKVEKDVIEKYAADNSAIIEIDEEVLTRMEIDVIKSRMVDYNEDNEVRHNSKKVAAMIFSLLLDV
jgi:hypothetical protein